MSRTYLFVVLIGLALLTSACGGQGHTHDDPAEERPTVAVTHWTDKTELFMEYPVFVVGQKGRSAIHVTDLKDFSPLSVGQAVVAMKSEDGKEYEFRGGPSRPGIFGVDLSVARAGVYEMTLRVDAPDLQDLHELGQVTVHAAGVLPAPGQDGEGDGISFLKEQQWTLDFGTALVETRPLRSSITVPAVVYPRAGGEAILAASVPGRLDSATDVPVPGTRVREGAVLARIVPRSDDLRDGAALRASLVQAEQDHQLATLERERVKRLVEARALPSRRFDEAEARLVSTEARLQAERQRFSRYEALSQSGDGRSHEGAFAVRAPFDGYVAEVRFAPGESVEENQALVRLVDIDRVRIVGAVPESRAAVLTTVDAGELLLDEGHPVSLARPLSVGQVVEPIARTTEVRFAFDNRPPRLQIGQSVKLRLFVGAEEQRVAIPESAVVDDGGQPVVFVQTGGESFTRRPVRLGSRTEGYVHVVSGVEPGERVVDRGAYLIRLAAMSTQIPAHGHVH